MNKNIKGERRRYLRILVRGKNVPDSIYSNDVEIFLEAVKKNYRALLHASENVQNNSDVALEAIRANGAAWQYIGKNIKRKREFLLNAVEIKPYLINEISPRHLTPKFLEEIIIRCPNVLDELDNNSLITNDLIEKTIIENPKVYDHVDGTYRDKRSLGLKAIKNNPEAFLYLSSTLQNDNKYLLKAVAANVRVVKYLTEKLRNDDDFFVQLLWENIKDNDSSILEYIDYSLINDKALYKRSVKLLEKLLPFMDEEVRNENILNIVKHFPEYYTNKFYNPYAKNNIEITLLAVRQNGLLLEHASKELQDNEKVVKEAIKNNPEAIKYASERVQSLLNKSEEDDKQELEEKEELNKEKKAFEEINNETMESLVELESKLESKKAYGNYDKMTDEDKKKYDDVMNKSFTKFFNKLSVEETITMYEIYDQRIKSRDPETLATFPRLLALATKLKKRCLTLVKKGSIDPNKKYEKVDVEEKRIELEKKAIGNK